MLLCMLPPPRPVPCHQTLRSRRRCCRAGPQREELVVLPELPPGLGEGDVSIRNIWGLDPFTRK